MDRNNGGKIMLAAALLTALTGTPFCYAAQQEEITLNVVIWYDFSIPEDFEHDSGAGRCDDRRGPGIAC